SILVLKSTLQQCRKNIITDFIGDKVLGLNLYYVTSDLGKILGKFNSIIQGKKLIVMNETSMSSREWHRFNSYLKSLITEGKDALLKIEAGDTCIVCFDISTRCRDNIAYFDKLKEILDYPDAPEVVMSYLLSCNLSKWSDIEEFSDIPQPETLTNESTNIP
ncbi:10939_t:CDS:2, partial [Scutellospora calospora]